MNLFVKLVLSFYVIFNSAVGNTSAGLQSEFKIKSISLFRNEVQLEIDNKNQLQVGNRLVAKSATSHKCLLVITKIQSRTAYADASQCPGFATLRKGQFVQVAGQDEVNEEVKVIRKYS